MYIRGRGKKEREKNKGISCFRIGASPKRFKCKHSKFAWIHYPSKSNNFTNMHKVRLLIVSGKVFNKYYACQPR